MPDIAHTVVSERLGNDLLPNMPIFGLHQVEADFPARGVWVTDRLVIPVALRAGTRVQLNGLYFPRLIEKQVGILSSKMRFILHGRQMHLAQLVDHGAFMVTFDVPADLDDGDQLTIECDKYFVPAQIQRSDDHRTLAWRLLYLSADNVDVFDCTRSQNVLVYRTTAAERRSEAGLVDTLLFHLDRPQPGPSRSAEKLLYVSGWVADVGTGRAPKVRLITKDAAQSAQGENRPDVRQALATASALPVPDNTGFWGVLRPSDGSGFVRVQAQCGVDRWTTLFNVLTFDFPVPTKNRLAVSQTLLKRLGAEGWFRQSPVACSVALLHGTVHFNLDAPKLTAVTPVKDGELFSGWAVNLQRGSAAHVRVWTGSNVHVATATRRPDVQKLFAHVKDLPIETGFSLVPPIRLGIHALKIEVEVSENVWHSVLQTLLIRVPGQSSPPRPALLMSYRSWVQHQQRQLEAELPEIRTHINVAPLQPVFTVVIDARSSTRDLGKTIASIQGQIYERFEIVVLVRSSRTRFKPGFQGIKIEENLSSLKIVGDFTIFLEPSQRLARNALYEFASAINSDADIDLVYGDHDIRQRLADPRPFHKPAWSPDYLETFNYIGFPAAFRTTIATRHLAAANHYDLVLRFTESTARIAHIGKILGHARYGPAQSSEQDVAALDNRLKRTGRNGTVRQHRVYAGCHEIELRLRQTPLVSVVIPTAGKCLDTENGKLDLIQNIVAQIRTRSTYTNVEIVIVDNGDLSETQIGMLEEAGCRRVTFSEPVFNISKKLNLGARIASGEILLLLNDDIEILTPTWIEGMLQHLEKPHVGVVGVKLLYPFGKIQHAGVVHNNGNPDHVRRLYARDDEGYFFSTCGVRNYSAVTGACMMTPASIYRQVGGYSEELAVSFNDIDYCLKVRARGFYVVYAPAVELTHMESVSRVTSLDEHELDWYHRRWASRLVFDDYYPELFLTVNPPTFETHINQRLV